MKLFVIPLLCSLFLSGPCVLAQQQRATSSQKQGKEKKKHSEIDLEALDIQGLIDRPQTLYILKKSKIDFYDTLEETDYVKAIVESTYKAPF